jgi:surfactin synthase thioesterase subunit
MEETPTLIHWGGPASQAPALICLPWAGAGAAPFRAWTDRLEEDVDVYGVRLPGRESRQSETAFVTVEAAVEALTQETIALPNREVVVFGQCTGAILAFELVRALQDLPGRKVLALFVASQIPPADMSEAAVEGPEQAEMFVEDAVLEEPELLELVLPAIVADIEMTASYAYSGARPIEAPVVVLRGSEDAVVTDEMIEGWSAESVTRPAFVRIPGGDHLLRGPSWVTVAEVIRERLRSLTTPQSARSPDVSGTKAWTPSTAR